MVKKYKNLKKSQKIVFFKKILNLFQFEKKCNPISFPRLGGLDLTREEFDHTQLGSPRILELFEDDGSDE